MKGFCEITYYDNTDPKNPKWVTRDAWEEYGIAFEKGTYNALFSLPAPKEPYTYDWGGSDGTEVHDDAPVVFKARSLTLPIIIISDSEQEFWGRYNAFRTLLARRQTIEFHFKNAGYIGEGCRFKLRRTGGGEATILGTVRGTGKKAMRLPITFSDDNPRILPLIPASVFDPEMNFDIIFD